MHLAAVAGSHVGGGNSERELEFCSYCGQLGAGRGRVCGTCGLGVRLVTQPNVLRRDGAAFLIVKADGRVSAVSAAAERTLGPGTELIGRPVLALFAPAGAADLARAVALTAVGSGGPFELTVEPIQGGDPARQLHATVATCGDPRAALVVLEKRPGTP
jgi:hypothetical protein